MLVIPTVNCPDLDCVKKRLAAINNFSPSPGWLQIDIADGSMTRGYESWRDLEYLKEIDFAGSLELHLMVQRPELILDSCFQPSVRRLIVHLESETNMEELAQSCREKEVELMLAIAPQTSLAKLTQYLEEGFCSAVQVLAVDPGLSGQPFQTGVVERIQELKESFVDVLIEVDGGINLETAALCKEAGADQLAVSSAIFSSPDPQQMYQQLLAV
ncbi:MAG: hypothetical protein Q8P45_03100 [Candidatus Harrisonbacteria bacterium]|nr:hypothetical protein [Candidatus Harrisonbacteria bacterium]